MSNTKELVARMQWSLSGINATVALVDYCNKGHDRGRKPIMVLEIISERFKSLPVFQRTMLVDDMVKSRDPALYKGLELAYECYTSDEYALGFQRKYELH